MPTRKLPRRSGKERHRNVRRKLGLATALALPLAAVLAAPVFAADTTNYAGRPINGFSYDSTNPMAPRQWVDWDGSGPGTFGYNYGFGTGHGIAYAKIDGRVALLYPWHGRDHPSFDGRIVYGKSDTKIGTWAADVCANVTITQYQCASHFDLAVIWIDAEDRPANLNRVYRGEVAGDNFWTITADPPTSHNCDGLDDGSEWGDDVAQNFQWDIAGWVPPATYTVSNITGFRWHHDAQNMCLVITDRTWHGPAARDSGTPFVLTSIPNTVFAFGTFQTNNKVEVTPLYGGLKVLDAYWETHGGNTGANLCTNAGCT
jgi:hypothetical protein